MILRKWLDDQLVGGSMSDVYQSVHGDSSEAPGGVGDWVLEGKERHRHRAAIGQGEELLRRTLLGALSRCTGNVDFGIVRRFTALES